MSLQAPSAAEDEPIDPPEVPEIRSVGDPAGYGGTGERDQDDPNGTQTEGRSWTPCGKFAGSWTG